jgi:hypothetical protein
MNDKNLKIYCVTNKPIEFIKKKEFYFGWVGKNQAPRSYINCFNEDNIFYKEKYYSELTFHYWYWKNLLKFEKEDQWVGFCQRRRYWIKNNSKKLINLNNINEYLLTNINDELENTDSFICEPIQISGANKIKLIKRGWRNIIKNPSILFNKQLETISVHFDMHHGYGNLDKAIKVLEVEDRGDFRDYVRSNDSFNPHIMFISKKKIMNKWFNTLFPWLKRCEKVFGFENLRGYDTTRIYAYLSERYLSFWFKKYTNFKVKPWIFLDN